MTKEEAIKAIKAWDFLNKDEKEVLETLIPELKEPEHERIRKEFCEDIWTYIPNEKAHKYIAWLEKQGIQNIIVTDEQIHWLKWAIIRLPDTEKGNEAETVLTEFVEQLEKQGAHEQVDGFDAELNALLKKYEHLPKEEVVECLQFYLRVVQGEQKPKWTEEDENKVEDVIYFLDTAKVHYASTKALDNCIEWLKSLKQRMEQ